MHTYYRNIGMLIILLILSISSCSQDDTHSKGWFASGWNFYPIRSNVGYLCDFSIDPAGNRHYLYNKLTNDGSALDPGLSYMLSISDTSMSNITIENASNTTGARMVIDSIGSAHIAFIQGGATGPLVYCCISNTIPVQTNLSSGSLTDRPAIGIDLSGRPYVADGLNSLYHYSDNTWTNCGLGTMIYSSTAMVMDNAGKPNIFSIGLHGTYDGTWNSASIPIDFNGNSSAVKDSLDRLHLCTPISNGILYSVASNATETNYVIGRTAGMEPVQTEMTVDTSGQVHILFSTYDHPVHTPATLWYVHGNTGNWTLEKLFEGRLNTNCGLRIRTDASGQVHVVFLVFFTDNTSEAILYHGIR